MNEKMIEIKEMLKNIEAIPGNVPGYMPSIKGLFEIHQNNPYHRFDNVGKHTVEALRYAPERFLVKVAILYHDTGKAFTKLTIDGVDTFRNHANISVEIAENELSYVGFSDEDLAKIIAMIKHHGREIVNTPKAIRRFIFKVGAENALNVLDVMIADDFAKDTNKLEVIERIHKNKQIREKVKFMLKTP